MNITKVEFGKLEGVNIINPQMSFISHARTHTLTNLEIGKHYIISPFLLTGSSGGRAQSGSHISAYTGCECTFLANARNSSDSYTEYLVYTHYHVVPTEETVTLTISGGSGGLEITKID